MAASDAPRATVSAANAAGFVLYVEGPSDRDILSAWAWRVSPDLSRALGEAVVILGGRQPARAVDHFRKLRSRDAGSVGLCVLDRDGADRARPPAAPDEPGLEFFTWGRRHIESYLLVPHALLRAAGLPPDDPRHARLVRRHLPPDDDEAAWRELHAKTLLAETGALARALGRPLPAGRVARQMDRRDLHADVLELLTRVAAGLAQASSPIAPPFSLPGGVGGE